MLRTRRRKLIAAGVASVAAGVVLSKLYNSQKLIRARSQYQRLALALSNYQQAFLTGADISSAITRDLQSFLQSDSNELPQSLRQLAKLAQAKETQAAATSLAAATAQGILSAARQNGETPSAGIDSLLDALTSERGHTLVSLAVSVAARTSTETYCECVERSAAAAKASEAATGVLADTLVQQLFRFACTPEGERLCMLGITNFVTNATAVYCEKLENASMWQDLFAAMVKPEHKEVAGQITRCFVNELTNTLRRPAPQISGAQPQGSDHQSIAQTARQLSGLPQASMQSQQATTKVHRHSQSGAEDGKQRPSLRLQAHTGTPPYSSNQLQGDKQHRTSVDVPLQQPWYSLNGAALLREAIKVLKVPEGRMMLLSLSAIAIAEGIQTGYHGVKEACSDNMGALQQVSLSEGGKFMGMSLRQLYAALSIVIMLMLYINGQRAALQHA